MCTSSIVRDPVIRRRPKFWKLQLRVGSTKVRILLESGKSFVDFGI